MILEEIGNYENDNQVEAEIESPVSILCNKIKINFEKMLSPLKIYLFYSFIKYLKTRNVSGT